MVSRSLVFFLLLCFIFSIDASHKDFEKWQKKQAKEAEKHAKKMAKRASKRSSKHSSSQHWHRVPVPPHFFNGPRTAHGMPQHVRLAPRLVPIKKEAVPKQKAPPKPTETKKKRQEAPPKPKATETEITAPDKTATDPASANPAQVNEQPTEHSVETSGTSVAGTIGIIGAIVGIIGVGVLAAVHRDRKNQEEVDQVSSMFEAVSQMLPEVEPKKRGGNKDDYTFF